LSASGAPHSGQLSLGATAAAVVVEWAKSPPNTGTRRLRGRGGQSGPRSRAFS
jgi:hypothetical protein